jgi:DNA ligase-1
MDSKCAQDLHVKELFDLIAKTSSSNRKKEIIAENSSDELFTLLLNYLLNPFLVTGISTKKIAKDVEKAPTAVFETFPELMDYILGNNTGSDEVIVNIKSFLEVQEPGMQDFYTSVITKTARLGCDVKTVNKAYGRELIPQWDVQQSYTIEKTPIKENEWFSLSQKLNGVRGTYYEGKLFSRQGKEFSGLEHILEDIRKLLDDPESWVLDGELIRINDEGLADNENFRIGTGLLGQDDADKSCMQFVVFDMLPKEEFIEGESKMTYKGRLDSLKTLGVLVAELGLQSIALVRVLYTGNDAEEIDRCLDKMVSEGKEGVMLNRDSKYYRKRHNGILKVKRFYTVDLSVIAVLEGSGRLTGRLGAFVANYKGNTLNVGSGMTDEQREEFWKIRDGLPGRVIEVKYKEESSDKNTGQLSLQFPIFVSLREEGKEVSYY